MKNTLSVFHNVHLLACLCALSILAALPQTAYSEDFIERTTRAVDRTNSSITNYHEESKAFWANGTPQRYESQTVSQRPSTTSNIAMPSPIVQYVANVPGAGLTAIPYQPYAGPAGTLIVVKPTYQPSSAPNYVTVRNQYGGVYPYTVVRSEKPFVIVSQENDILVIGVENPKRLVVQNNQSYTIVGNPPVITPINNNPPVNIIYQTGRIKMETQLPPGVPADLLQKIDHFDNAQSTIEATYQPNRRKARSSTATTTDAEGTTYEVFKINLN